jgi:hypothetical protein
MPGYPLQPQAQQLAQAGRYGDTMLMHVNPAEVQGLASIMPLTTNPETGQPEAFLPFLIPLLGSILGTTALPAALTGMGAAAGAGGLGTALGTMGGFLGTHAGIAGAIGSGAAEWARTGDFKQGLMSGLTGYGAGKVLGGLGKQATKEALTKTAQDALGGAVTEGTAERLASDALRTAGATTPPKIPWGNVQQGALATQGITPAAQKELASKLMAGASGGLGDAGGIWAKEGLKQGLRNPGQLLAAAQQPGAMLPLVGGMGMSSAEESRRLWEEQMAQFDVEEEERKRRIEAEHPEVIPISNPYSRRYGLQGGIVA